MIVAIVFIDAESNPHSAVRTRNDSNSDELWWRLSTFPSVSLYCNKLCHDAVAPC